MDSEVLPIFQTEQLQIVDKQGEVKAVLGTNSVGLPAFIMRDNDGIQRMEIGLSTNGSATIQMNNTKGEMCISILLDASGQCSMGFHDHIGQLRTSLTLLTDRPMFALQDAHGNPRMIFSLLPNGDPMVSLQDEFGRPHGGIISTP